MLKVYEIAYASDRGKTRKNSANQDAVRVVEPSLFTRKPPLLILADGMGGHAGGALASQFVVDAFVETFKKKISKTDPLKLLESAVHQAHKRVQLKSQSNSHLSDMGSTVVAVILEEEHIHMVNVGDSRLYLFRGKKITQISYDHSVVADKVRRGEITEYEARNHPQRNRLTMSISAHRSEISFYSCDRSFDFNDVILLCSDGLWATVPEEYIRTAACQLPARKATKKLIDMANSLGSPDNISVVIARRVGSTLERDEEMA